MILHIFKEIVPILMKHKNLKKFVGTPKIWNQMYSGNFDRVSNLWPAAEVGFYFYPIAIMGTPFVS